MKNKIAFVIGTIFSLWMTLSTFNFVNNVIPVQTIALSIPTLSQKPVHTFSQADLNCLHENIFFEARNQPLEGMKMVGIVTIKRTEQPEFAHTICGVVHEHAQFSWTLKNHKVNHKDKIEDNAWEYTGVVAENLLNDYNSLDNNYNGLVYYHATRIKPPHWTHNLKKEFTIGSHIFYSKGNNETFSIALQ